MTFTPGSDEGRTDTFEAQTAEPDRSIDKRVEEDFDKAQTILKRTGEALYNLGLVGVGLVTGSPQAVQGVQALRAKIEGKPFTPPIPNPNNLGGLVTLEPITTEEAFTRPDMTGTGEQPIIEDVPQYPVVVQRILKVKKDNPGFFSNIVNSIGKDNTQNDDALTRRYYEINNPDSYDTDPLSPTYGKLKSDITFTPSEQFSLNLPDIDPITSRNMLRRAMDNNLLRDGRLDYGAFLTSNRFVPGYRRLIAGDYATPPSAGLPYAKLTRRTQYQSRQTAFNNYRRELIDEFKDIYGDDMSRLGFTESRLDLDHRLTLVQSLGMLHNTAPGDKLWKRITEYAIKRGYTPGDARPNLGLLDPESHRVKTNFFNNLHGLNEGNLKYWNGQHRNTGKTRYEIMSESHLSDEAADLHMEVVEDYFDVVDQGDKVLRDAQAIFKAEYKLDILPEEIAEELMPVILSKQYSPKTVQNAIKDIVERDRTNIRQLQETVDLLEFIEDYEAFPDGPLTRQEYELIDPKDIADAKRELAKLRRVGNRKSYIQRLLDKRERTLKRSIERDKESGQLRLPIDD